MNSIYLILQHNSYCIRDFFDIYGLIMKNKNSLDRVYFNKILDNYDAKKYIIYVIYYTYLIFKDKSVFSILGLDINDVDLNFLKCYGLTDFEKKKWNCDFYTRLFSKDKYKLINDQLSTNDLKKIQINRMFL